MKYISIIDMEINNLKSIVGAINHFGFKTIITNNQKQSQLNITYYYKQNKIPL